MDMADQLVRSSGDGDAFEVDRLLGRGAVVDAPNRGGRTALDRAAEQGRADVVRGLLAAGADPEQQAGEYRESTPLCLAASRGHTAVVGELLDAGAPTGAQGRLGWVPLVLAATTGDEGHAETVDLLLDRGADINAAMRHRTALDWAVWFGQEAMVHRLLGRGAVPSIETLAAAREYREHHPEGPRKAERIAIALLAGYVTPGTRREPGTSAGHSA
ncbi:ankyrin repeat domain-containing protein [Streptomyces sp. H27-G5]|uniref:ankyrin repeat domain-containing protein n=1 Tax=Streptomyces sp. H27-G5 TaxID=2996698 RepID=UPI002271B169|nr:ankyrin repeat domain-containing protein [Streptomyces sp. H27-G5]MCY0921977.1 ankyrin repeat domain-containing protein [Streptomyces sp. H27-G5]